MVSVRFLSLLLLSPPVFTATVRLGNTTITGQDFPRLKQEFFGGIPFAEKPLGNLRFRPPVLKTSLGVANFNATAFGLPCVSPLGVATTVGSTEDCLTINIFRPASLPSDARLPVMAWIYGGAFITGSASTFNGSSLVSQSVVRGTPVIYVNFNYRVGPLGFPQGSEAEAQGALNLGLKDQLAALEWIQANIGAFGGDKTKVTVFGESAGAVSVSFLYLNSGLERLAHAAILESGTAGMGPVFHASHRQNDWKNFVSAVPECSELADTENTFGCLRNASTSTLLDAFVMSTSQTNELIPWSPTIDGSSGIIPTLPSELFAKGMFANIPFITGHNLDEGTYFTPSGVNSSETIREWIVANYTASSQDVPLLDAAATRILQLYPDNPALGSPFNTGNETFGLNIEYKRLAAITGDIWFHSLRRLWIQSASKHGVKTFGYLFSDAPPAIIPPSLGVPHSIELEYLFPDSEDIVFPGLTLGPAAQNLSIQMLDYWVSFATSLNPNDGKGTSRPEWPQYTSKNQQLIQLNSANLSTIPDDYRAEQIAFINSHSALFRH